MEQSEKNTGLFEELMEAVEDINQWREGKVSLTSESLQKPKSYATLRAKMTPESRAVSAEQTRILLEGIRTGR